MNIFTGIGVVVVFGVVLGPIVVTLNFLWVKSKDCIFYIKAKPKPEIDYYVCHYCCATNYFRKEESAE